MNRKNADADFYSQLWMCFSRQEFDAQNTLKVEQRSTENGTCCVEAQSPDLLILYNCKCLESDTRVLMHETVLTTHTNF